MVGGRHRRGRARRVADVVLISLQRCVVSRGLSGRLSNQGPAVRRSRAACAGGGAGCAVMTPPASPTPRTDYTDEERHEAHLRAYSQHCCGLSSPWPRAVAAAVPAAVPRRSAGSTSAAARRPASTAASPPTGRHRPRGTCPSGTGSITVGSADFPENALLADIYGDAMSAKGVKVTKKLNIGERPAYIAALKDGSIDFVPEYTGSILSYLDTDGHGQDARRRVHRAADGRGQQRLRRAQLRRRRRTATRSPSPRRRPTSTT